MSNTMTSTEKKPQELADTPVSVRLKLSALWVSVMFVSLGSVSVNVGTTLLADLSEGGRLGPRLGAFRFTGDGAFLIAPLLAGWLLGTQGRAIAMLPLVVLTGVVLIGCVIWVPETHRRNVVRPT